MANIFISYNRQDEDKTKALVIDIEELGHTVWFDHELSGGEEWWQKILHSIRECDIFIFVLSKDSLESTACSLEYGYSNALGKTIIPVLVGEGVSPNLLPPALSKIQFIDYRERDRDAVLHLAKAFTTSPSSLDLPDPLPSPPEVPLSYLGGFVNQINTTSKLSYDEQIVLVAKLKRSLQDPESTNDAQKLLKSLRKRRDILANIAEEIDELLKSAGKVTKITSNKDEESISVTEKKAQKQDIGQNSGNHGKIIIFVIVLLIIAAGVTYFYFGQNHQADKVQPLPVIEKSAKHERDKKKLEEFKHKQQAEAEKQRTREEERRKQETKEERDKQAATELTSTPETSKLQSTDVNLKQAKTYYHGTTTVPKDYTKYKVVNVASNDTLNIRNNPFVELNNIIGELQPYARNIRVLECKANFKGVNWCKIESYEGSYALRGWVAGRYLVPQNTPETSRKIYQVINIRSNDTLAVRNGPGTQYAKIGDLAYNAKGVKIVNCQYSNKSGKWCRIKYGNMEGWVSATYLREQ